MSRAPSTLDPAPSAERPAADRGSGDRPWGALVAAFVFAGAAAFVASAGIGGGAEVPGVEPAPAAAAAPAQRPAAAPADDAAEDPGDAAAEAPADGAIEVVMTDFAFDLPEGELPAGEVTFRVRNVGVAPHQFALGAVGSHGAHVADSGTLDAGATADVTVELAPGTYEIACHVPGHYEAGMATTITVV